MEKEELIIKLEQFKSGLIEAATNGSFSDKEYTSLRNDFLSNSLIKDELPHFIKIYRTPIEFRRFMQGEYEHYKERRSFITTEINKVISVVEEYGDSDIVSNVESLGMTERLGNGGYGEVYLYHHDILDIDFAMKFFEPLFASAEEQKEGEKRFFREAKILFQLHSDYIVQIYDAGYFKGKAFIRMEYIEGYDLNKFLEKYSILPFDRSVNAILQILDGLQYAHDKGIIHRDLKPSNIMYSTKQKILKIIDFGISAFMDFDGHTKLTKTGENVAGGSYIDPQLQINPKLRDRRSDIYSVGAIWYYLLTGQVPSGADMRNNLISIAQVNEKEADIVLKCLAYNLSDRYSSCSELKNILLEIKNST